MKINTLKLRNFGIYEDKMFQMKDVMILLDGNGAGKSTFLKALNYALCGEFEEGMLRNSAEEMSVELEFSSGLKIERRRKNGINSSKMGFGQVKTATKEVVNGEIARLCNSKMESIRVIASSRELFEMKPDVLADFFMKHIPNKMDWDMIVSYISGITEPMKAEMKKILPLDGEFGQEQILTAFEKFEAERKEYAKKVKGIKVKTENYDFHKQFRPLEEIHKEIDDVLKDMGAREEKKRVFMNYQNLKNTQNQMLVKMTAIKEEYGKLKATKPEPEELMRLEEKEKELNTKVLEYSNMLSAAGTSLSTLQNIIYALENGMCPHIRDYHCPNDWKEQLELFLNQKQTLEIQIQKIKSSIQNLEKEIKATQSDKDAYERNLNIFKQKQQMYQEYLNLKASMIYLPEEPPQYIEEDFTNRRSELQKELEQSLFHEQLLKEKEQLAGLTEKLKLYETLCKAFSKKGEILQKNLEHYMIYFENIINEKAERLGYTIKLSSEGGLKVYIRRSDDAFTEISHASRGERAIAIFLLLDVLNSITGIRLLFFDEVEILDNEVWKKLCMLIKENKDFYDHIIMAGINHSDTVSVVEEIFS